MSNFFVLGVSILALTVSVWANNPKNIDLPLVSESSSANQTDQAPIRLQAIRLIANSTGPITPRFIYKGVVDSAAEELVDNPADFSQLINGSSLSSVSPNDGGQFYVSQGGGTDAPLSRMLRRIQNIRSTMIEIRFGNDDVGLAGDLFINGVGIYQIPFTVWDLNGTPDNTSDDIQLIVVTYNLMGDPNTWGIRNENPSSWLLNPAKESDWIYLFYPATSYADFQAAYITQQQSGQPANFYDTLLGPEVLSRITINSLDANPLTTLNNLNGLPRPKAGTTIRWTFQIDPPVTVLSPNGGEDWNEGKFYPIRWQTNDFYNITRIKLSYSIDNGVSYTIISDSTENDGLFVWQVPGTPSTQALIKANAYASGVLVGEDISDDTFIVRDIDIYVHRTGTMAHTIRNNGIYGSYSGTVSPDEPSLEFPENSGHHHVYLQNILIGTINPSGDTLAILTWDNDDFYPVTQINKFVRADYTETASICRDKIGIGTEMETRTFAFANHSFIIFFHKIYNIGSVNYPNVYVGAFADFDINGYSENLCGYDAANRLGYMFDATGGWSSYAAIRLMDSDPLAFRRAGSVTGNIDFSVADIFKALAIPGIDDPSTDPAEDYRVFESAGPFSLNQNDTIRFAYAVISENGLTNLTSASQQAQSIWNGPTINSSSVSEITEASASLNATINPNYLETNVFFEYGETADYGQMMPAGNNPLSGSSPVSVSVHLTNLSPGKNYHWRVVVVNPVKVIFENDQTFSTLEYPQNINIAQTFSFPEYTDINQYQSQDYRLIGFPGNYNGSISNLLPGEQGKDWEVYWDNGENSSDPNNYLVKFNGGANFLCSTGKAFWVIYKGNWQVSSLQINSAPLNSTQAAEISLHAGWNLITNPFDSTISWPDIQNINGITEPIYNFDENFNMSVSFNPYTGYYFYNDPNQQKSVLKIPYSLTSPNPNLPPKIDPALWRIGIRLISGPHRDNTFSIGVAPNAKAQLDALDYRKPRSIGNTPQLIMSRPDWTDYYSIFATDIRPEFDEIETWEFEVHADKQELIDLKFDGIGNIPGKFSVILVDQNSTSSINLRENQSYKFLPVTKVSQFKVIVGTQNKVEQHIRSLLPTTFSLGNNYPNPFNSSTTIPLAVPTPSEVSLTVFNVIGQKISTIYQGKLNSGRYWFNWQGRDTYHRIVPSGIYLIELKTEAGIYLVNKMILMK